MQDPSKDVLALRQLFPTRIALRLREATQAGMVARSRRARSRCALRADPRLHARVGYVAEDGSAEITRVRAFHVTDEDIARTSAAYQPSCSAIDPCFSCEKRL